ncbi:hypothetical protein D9M70_642280 [compost metagenome]
MPSRVWIDSSEWRNSWPTSSMKLMRVRLSDSSRWLASVSARISFSWSEISTTKQIIPTNSPFLRYGIPQCRNTLRPLCRTSRSML